MVVRLVVDTRCHRRIRQHDVDLMQAQGGEKMVERAFSAYQLGGLLQVECCLEQTLCDFLWKDVIDANHKSQRTGGVSMSQRVEQIAAYGENLFRIAEDDP